MGRKRKNQRWRLLTLEEKEKRGCTYCLDINGKTYATRCPHDVCPYHELDKYEYYEDFLISEEAHAEGAVIAKVNGDKCPLYPGGTELWMRWQEVVARRAEKEKNNH